MAANALLSLLLPDGILKRFEFVKCDQEDTGRKDLLSDDNVIQINIYLDERDNRTEEEKKALRPNGFTESRSIQDFPLRNRRVVLHVRRRRWLTSEGKSVVLNHDQLTAPGTEYSQGFGNFLKGTFGTTPRNVTAPWEALYPKRK